MFPALGEATDWGQCAGSSTTPHPGLGAAVQAPFQQLSASNTSGRPHGWRAVTMEAAYAGSGKGDLLSRRKNCRDPLQMLGLKVLPN